MQAQLPGTQSPAPSELVTDLIDAQRKHLFDLLNQQHGAFLKGEPNWSVQKAPPQPPHCISSLWRLSAWFRLEEVFPPPLLSNYRHTTSFPRSKAMPCLLKEIHEAAEPSC